MIKIFNQNFTKSHTTWTLNMRIRLKTFDLRDFFTSLNMNKISKKPVNTIIIYIHTQYMHILLPITMLESCLFQPDFGSKELETERTDALSTFRNNIFAFSCRF